MSGTSDSARPVVGVQAVVMRDRAVLLQQRAGAFGAGTWGLPGGHLEFGESFEAAAAREVREETGLKVHGLRPFTSVNTAYKQTHYVQIGLWAAGFSGTPVIMEPQKCTGLAFFPLDALPKPLFAPSEPLLEHVSKVRNPQRHLEPTFLAHFRRHDPSRRIDRYAQYWMVGEEVVTVVARFGRQGERRARQERILGFTSRIEALDHLGVEFRRRLLNGYILDNADGTIRLDELKSLIPKRWALRYTTSRSVGDSPHFAQPPLPFESDG